MGIVSTEKPRNLTQKVPELAYQIDQHSQLHRISVPRPPSNLLVIRRTSLDDLKGPFLQEPPKLSSTYLALSKGLGTRVLDLTFGKGCYQSGILS